MIDVFKSDAPGLSGPPDDSCQWAYDRADDILVCCKSEIAHDAHNRIRDLLIDALIDYSEDCKYGN